MKMTKGVVGSRIERIIETASRTIIPHKALGEEVPYRLFICMERLPGPVRRA
jgi:hypothetical protein